MGGDLEKCFLPDLKTYFDPHFYFTDSGDLRDELLISELDGYSCLLVLFSSLKISYISHSISDVGYPRIRMIPFEIGPPKMFFNSSTSKMFFNSSRYKANSR